ncbi:MAG: porin, partial [Proteobacteria bacterium]|nr:porin [Pseudomonadota bacterium]
MLPLSQAAMAEVTISGWVNEGVTFYDDGTSSDAVQITDGGNTLGTRMIFAASTEAATGLTVGMEIALEPQSSGTILGWGTLGVADDDQFDSLGVLNNNVWVSGAWGKITFGSQSMPTDNIAVLEDPSL